MTHTEAVAQEMPFKPLTLGGPATGLHCFPSSVVLSNTGLLLLSYPAATHSASLALHPRPSSWPWYLSASRVFQVVPVLRRSETSPPIIPTARQGPLAPQLTPATGPVDGTDSTDHVLPPLRLESASPDVATLPTAEQSEAAQDTALSDESFPEIRGLFRLPFLTLVGCRRADSARIVRIIFADGHTGGATRAGHPCEVPHGWWHRFRGPCLSTVRRNLDSRANGNAEMRTAARDGVQ